MGMKPKIPNKDLFEALVHAEKEIKARKQAYGEEKSTVILKKIEKLKRGLFHSNDQHESVLADALAVGFFWASVAPEAEYNNIQKYKKFDRTNKSGAKGSRSQSKEVISYVFNQCIANGRFEPLLPGKFQNTLNKKAPSFLNALKTAIKTDSFVGNLIKSVSKTHIIPIQGRAITFKTAQNIISELRNLPDNKKHFNP